MNVFSSLVFKRVEIKIFPFIVSNFFNITYELWSYIITKCSFYFTTFACYEYIYIYLFIFIFNFFSDIFCGLVLDFSTWTVALKFILILGSFLNHSSLYQGLYLGLWIRIGGLWKSKNQGRKYLAALSKTWGNPSWNHQTHNMHRTCK